VGGTALLAAICLLTFSRYSSSYCSWVLVVPLSKVWSACIRNAMPDSRSLVVLQVLPVSAEICGSRASMLALMLDAGPRGAAVTMMLPFLVRHTTIGRAT